MTEETTNASAFLEAKKMEKAIADNNSKLYHERSEIISKGINYALIGLVTLCFTLIIISIV